MVNELYEQLQTSLYDIISEKAGANKETLTPKTTFEELGVDSLDSVEIVMAIEDQYLIEVPDADAEKFKTLDEIMKYVVNNSEFYVNLRER